MSFLFLGNNRQYITACAEIISFWVRKVLSIAKANMSLGTLQGTVMSAALMTGVSPVTILWAGDKGLHSN